MGVNWALGFQQGPNAGDRFNNSFQQGLENNKQHAAQNAMATLVQNPNDPQALAALAKLDPATAMKFRQQQIEYHKAQLAEHQDSILKGRGDPAPVQPAGSAKLLRSATGRTAGGHRHQSGAPAV
jgi:hypothetical protein